MTGGWGDRLMEVGACWAIVMALTGYYLFCARPEGARRTGSARPTARAATRHGLIGAVAGVGLL